MSRQMATATSPQKRQANRRNALKSTGPKSPAGKRRASRNARLHGLSGASERSTTNPLLSQLSSLIAQDGTDPVVAQDIALKIVSYERNQEYQRALFVQAQESSLSELAVDQEMRHLFETELDLMADVLDEQEHEREHEEKDEGQHEELREGFRGRVDKSDLDFVVNMQRKMLKLTVRQAQRREQERLKRVHHSIRYLKRSSNQLIGSIKRLRES